MPAITCGGGVPPLLSPRGLFHEPFPSTLYPPVRSSSSTWQSCFFFPSENSFDAALLACAVGGQGARATSLLAEMATLEAEHRLARLGEEENTSPSSGAYNVGRGLTYGTKINPE